MPPHPASHPLLEAMRERPLVLDAAMGTRLIARGLDLTTDDPGRWNASHPDQVQNIHERDIAAGSTVLVSNTFGLNRPWLERIGRERDYDQLNRAACALAWRAAGPERFVLGGIGPAAISQPGAVADQAARLLDHGVSAILLETFDPDAALRALAELAPVRSSAAPVLVSLWKWPDPPASLAHRLVDAGADVLGINCEPSLDLVIGFAQQISDLVRSPVFVKPSTARPGEIAADPADWDRAIPRLIAAGARLIGGCCGTTEAHVAIIARQCAAWSAGRPAGRALDPRPSVSGSRT